MQAQVCWWDDRESSPLPAATTDFDTGHRDIVNAVRWVGKTGAEFMTGSQDGTVKVGAVLQTDHSTEYIF